MINFISNVVSNQWFVLFSFNRRWLPVLSWGQSPPSSLKTGSLQIFWKGVLLLPHSRTAWFYHFWRMLKMRFGTDELRTNEIGTDGLVYIRLVQMGWYTWDWYRWVGIHQIGKTMLCNLRGGTGVLRESGERRKAISIALWMSLLGLARRRFEYKLSFTF